MGPAAVKIREKNCSIDESEKKRLESKEKFWDSLTILIKRIILQCNYILNNELKDEKEPKKKIYKNFQYPNIIEPFTNESYLNFIKNIDNILLKIFNYTFFTNSDLILINLNRQLLVKIEEIFKFKEQYFYNPRIDFAESIDNSALLFEDINCVHTIINRNDFHM